MRYPGTEDQAILVPRTLRSGQSVSFAGHVVVVGDVNPGAEVIAGGNIIVLGTLRGVAHAGAGGKEEAFIAAFRLRPTQLRIGKFISRPPDNEEEESDTGGPEVARVKEGVVVIEKLPLIKEV